MKLIFATHNKHKIEEAKKILSQEKFQIYDLTDINYNKQIPEDFDTLEENARQKALTIFNETGLNSFSDDTGLFIESLNGEPGVFSARYAGENCSFEDNVRKVLEKMTFHQNRSAYFKTTIALIIDGKEYFFNGIVQGTILLSKSGKSGFGYDPVFCPKGFSMTYAEMSSELKNKISHRALALTEMVNFLNKL